MFTEEILVLLAVSHLNSPLISIGKKNIYQSITSVYHVFCCCLTPTFLLSSSSLSSMLSVFLYLFVVLTPVVSCILCVCSFSYEGRWKQKLQTSVDVPLDSLDLTQYVIGPRQTLKRYGLFGVSVSSCLYVE